MFFVVYAENLLKGRLMGSTTTPKYFKYNSKVHTRKNRTSKCLLKF